MDVINTNHERMTLTLETTNYPPTQQTNPRRMDLETFLFIRNGIGSHRPEKIWFDFHSQSLSPFPLPHKKKFWINIQTNLEMKLLNSVNLIQFNEGRP